MTYIRKNTEQIISKLILICFSFFIVPSYGQNCSVNANVDFSICESDVMELKGSKGGLFANDSSTKWVQIQGPSVIIATPYQTHTQIIGHIPGYTYGFRLESICEDGVSISDSVFVTVHSVSTAVAGENMRLCPGTYQLQANVPEANEIGEWSIVGINNGVSIQNKNNPTSSITLSGAKSGNTILRWTLTGQNGCISFSDMIITNRGGLSNVAASTPVNVNSCYSNSTSATLNANFAGSGIDGQRGFWTLYDGPSYPEILFPDSNKTAVRLLFEGTYTFLWTVEGPCQSGSTIVDVIVPAESEELSAISITNSTQTHCNQSNTITLVATAPSNPNETVVWTQITNLPAIIESPNSPNTSISGLNGIGPYRFRYRVTNTETGCTSYKDANINFTTSPSISVPNEILILDTDSVRAKINYSVSGGNTTHYAIISTPLGMVDSVQFRTASNPLIIDSLYLQGQYIIRIKRFSTSAFGSCEEANKDIYLYTSFTPSESNAGTNQILACNVTSTTIVGNPGTFESSFWKQISGPTTVIFNDSTNHIADIDNLSNGAYIFRWSLCGGINAPISYSDVKVYVASNPPTEANAGSDVNQVCYLSTYRLNGNLTLDNEFGNWQVIPSQGIFFSDINNPNSNVHGFSEGQTYQFIWTIENACGISSDTMFLTTNYFPGNGYADAGADQCLSGFTTQTNLQANTPQNGIGTWSQITGNPCNIVEPNNANTIINGLSIGTYSFEWKIEDNECHSVADTVIITISDFIYSSFAGNDTSICGNMYVMNASSPENGQGLWQQLSGPNFVIFTEQSNPNTTIENLTDGNYLFSWKVFDGACGHQYDTVIIHVSTPPTQAFAGSDIQICPPLNSTILQANAPSCGFGYWTQVNGPNILNIQDIGSPNSLVNNFRMGTYTLRWNIQGGVNCPISYDEINIEFTPAAYAGGSTLNICDRESVTLVGNAFGNGTWSLVNGDTTVIITTIDGNTAIASNLQIGNYTFKYTLTSSCASSANILVRNYAMPTFPDAGENQNLCNAESVELTANQPEIGTGRWSYSGNSNGSFDGSLNSNNITYNDLSAGTHRFRWTITNGACVLFDNVYVNNFAEPTQSEAGPDKIVCGLSTQLEANLPTIGMGRWEMISGTGTATFGQPINPISNVTCSEYGTYIFRWKITNGYEHCPDNISHTDVEINFVSNAPITPIAGSTINTCNTNPISLEGNDVSPAIGSWEVISGPNVPQILNITNPNASLSNIEYGHYKLTWKANYDGCQSTDTLFINVYQAPSIAVATDEIELCQFSTLNLTANSPEIGYGTWSQISGPTNANIIQPTSNQTLVTGIIPGIYKFEWKISNQSCTPQRDTSTVIVYDLPSTASSCPVQNLCDQDDAVIFGNLPTVGNGVWSFVSGPNIPNINSTSQTHATVSNLTYGEYVFRWTISNGICSSSSTSKIRNFKNPGNFTAPMAECVEGKIHISSDSATFQTFTLKDVSNNTLQTWTGNSQTFTFENIPNGNYKTSISRQVCTTESQVVNLTNIPLPTPPTFVISNRNNLCPFDQGMVNIESIGGIGDSTYWFINDTTNSPIFQGEILSTLAPQANTQYYVIKANQCGVSESNSTIIFVSDTLLPTAQVNTIIIETNAGECSISNTLFSTPQAQDNCGIISIENDIQNTYSVGNHFITWTITDFGGNTVQIPQELHVISRPIAHHQTESIPKNLSAHFSVLSNVSDCDNNIDTNSLVLISEPTHGTFSINSSGIIEYMPSQNFVGQDSLTYQICDEHNLCTQAKVFIHVFHPNTPPVINDTVIYTLKNNSVEFSIPIFDEYEFDPFILSYVNCFANGYAEGFIVGDSLKIVYDPNSDFIGIDTICVQVCDLGGLCGSALIIVNTLDDPLKPTIGIVKSLTKNQRISHGDYQIEYTFIVKNMCQTNLYNIKIEDSLSMLFPSPMSYYVNSISSGGILNVNTHYNGGDFSNLLSSGNILGIGKSDTIRLTITLSPNNTFGTFSNNAYASATNQNMNITTDISNNGFVIDENENGICNEYSENTPTPISIAPFSQIGLALALTNLSNEEETNYLVDLQYTIVNIGNDNLSKIELINHIQEIFRTENFQITSMELANGNLQLNPLFDGKNHLSMTEISHNNTLAVNEMAVINLQLKFFNINKKETFYVSNSVIARGIEENEVMDISNNGFNVDPNNNGIANEANENIPTPIEMGKNSIWIPEGFSPNNDGINDCFVIEGFENQNVELYIYNRWGNLVYENKNYNNDWNGKSNKNINSTNTLPDDTYYYVIRYSQNKSLQGAVVIKR